MSDPLTLLLEVNLAAAFALAAVLALRLPVRRLFGAGVAYGLWSLVPLAALAMLAPARVIRVTGPASALVMDMEPVGSAPVQVAAAPALDVGAVLVVVWALGAALSLVYLAWRQVQFGRAMREGRAGPAVIGVLRPRVVTPDDFDHRYTEREQLVVLAHEQTHIARHDSRINALVALARCVNWFNPLVHLCAHYLRIDQELACDARVVAAHPTARRTYAEAMLKTQLCARPLPLGCYWPAQSAHPLAERIRLLARKTPGRGRRRAGAAVVALLALGAGWSAWAARPAQVVVTPAAPAATAVAEVPAQPPAALSTPSGPHAPAPRPDSFRDRRVSVPPAAGPDPVPDTAPAPPPREPEHVAAAPQVEPTAAWRDIPPLPPRRIMAAARRSFVAPGSAVRVEATMIDPDGVPLITDLTAYGSQSFFRTGYFRRVGSRYALFTSVVQHGDTLRVTASLDGRFDPRRSGSIDLRPGQKGQITLPGGEVVTVTPTVRAESPDEIETGRRMMQGRGFAAP